MAILIWRFSELALLQVPGIKVMTWMGSSASCSRKRPSWMPHRFTTMGYASSASHGLDSSSHLDHFSCGCRRWTPPSFPRKF